MVFFLQPVDQVVFENEYLELLLDFLTDQRRTDCDVIPFVRQRQY